MKILIMGFAKLKFMPYMNFYLDNISSGNEVHIIYWNRDNKPEDLKPYEGYVLHEFNKFQADEVPIYTKVGSFLKYRQFALRILKEENFDFIIVLHTLPGLLILDKLKKFSDRYILDYRDSTYEKFGPFKEMVHRLAKWSKVTFVSSDAFRQYLPTGERLKIITSHNILLDSLKHQSDKEKYNIPSDKIRIAFWGFIRHLDVNIRLIDRLANDDRFELHYYGREQQTALRLKEYALEKRAENIYFHGEYMPEERYQFLRQTDIIHNLYWDNNTLLAMGNKFYDGVIFRLPQVCMPGSFMGDICDRNGIGISLDPANNDFADRLACYYKSVDYQKFKDSCNSVLGKILREYNEGCKVIKSCTRN